MNDPRLETVGRFETGCQAQISNQSHKYHVYKHYQILSTMRDYDLDPSIELNEATIKVNQLKAQDG
jgi:hypothetical protein